MKCPTNRRGHKWGGRETVDNAVPFATADTKYVVVARRTCLGCGAPGVVTTQGRTIAVTDAG